MVWLSMTRCLFILIGLIIAFSSDAAYAQRIKFPNLLPFRQQHKVEPVPLTDQPASRPLLSLPRFQLNPAPSMGTALERLQSHTLDFWRATGESMNQMAHRTGNRLRNSAARTWNFFHWGPDNQGFWQPAEQDPGALILPPRNSWNVVPDEPRVRF